MAKVGRPKKDSEGILVRLPRHSLDQLNEAILSEEDAPSRPEMIRRILDDWFRLKQKKD